MLDGRVEVKREKFEELTALIAIRTMLFGEVGANLQIAGQELIQIGLQRPGTRSPTIRACSVSACT